MTDRRGFTLVELLVVIAIIGTLISLLLPAGRRRTCASWRQVSCKNNLKQLALAIHAYETNNGLLPRSGQFDPPAHDPYEGDSYTELRSGPMLSWIVAILRTSSSSSCSTASISRGPF